MAIAAYHCPVPIRRRLDFAPRDHDRRDRAIELFDAGRQAEAVRETFAYLLPELPIPELGVEPLCFVQGTARVRASIDAEGLLLTTVLAALSPQTQAMAALRFMLTRLSSTGQMFQPRLRGEVITLEFRDRLTLLHPLKLIEVLQRLPMEAARNDDWMAGEFGVTLPDREPLQALSRAEFERAEALWHGHWAAVEALMTESLRRRSLRLLDALGTVAVHQLRYALPLQGALRARLNEGAGDYTDKELDPNKREAALARAIRAMRQVGSDELRASLGHAAYAINPLQEGTPSLLTSTLGGGHNMQATGELRAAGRSLEAALVLIADYLFLLASYSWPADVEHNLRAGLDLASDRPWREAADALWNHANATARVYGSHGEHDGEDDEAEGGEGRP